VSRKRQILVSLSVILITGIAIAEHLYRRQYQARFEVALAEQQRLEDALQRVHLSHSQLKGALKQETARTEELHRALDEKSAQLDEAMNRLAAETRTIRDLQARLDIMQGQMDSLQGELLVSIERQVANAASAKEGKQDNSIELQKVVVGNAQNASLEGKVVSVHPDWSFVIVNLGWDAVNIGDTVSIFRNDQKLAEARIERVQEGLSAATLLPEFDIKGVQVDDIVRAL
jgi:hypothetical protein